MRLRRSFALSTLSLSEGKYRTQVAAVFATTVLSLIPVVNFSGLLVPVSSLTGQGRLIGLLFRLMIKELRSFRSDPIMLLLVVYSFTIAIYATATGASTEATFAVLRAVSDDANASLPMAARHATNPDGRANIQSVLEALRAEPSQFFDLHKTAFEFVRAIGRLYDAYRVIGPDFCFQ
jgi:hypothetical protein